MRLNSQILLDKRIASVEALSATRKGNAITINAQLKAINNNTLTLQTT